MAENQKVAVVTGANKGIGFSLVKELAKVFEGVVYLTARNETLGNQAVKDLESQGINVKFHQLDISDIESIRRFESYIRITHGGLDVLINNAALLCNPNSSKPIKQQIEEVVNVNYFGNLNLCVALFPLLRPFSRVVNVTSDWGLPYYLKNEYFKNTLLDEKQTQTIDDVSEIIKEYCVCIKRDDYKPTAYEGYKVSKNAINLITKLQQQNIEKIDNTILINSCNPGDVKTDMNSTGSITPEKACETILYLALQPHDSTIPRGAFWYEMKNYEWNDLSLDLKAIFGNVFDFDDINSR